jgi:hypothetical protein
MFKTFLTVCFVLVLSMSCQDDLNIEDDVDVRWSSYCDGDMVMNWDNDLQKYVPYMDCRELFGVTCHYDERADLATCL